MATSRATVLEDLAVGLKLGLAVYREHKPRGPLAPFVTCFWELTSTGDPYRVLPDGAMDVLVAGGDRSARVVGTMTRAIVAATTVPSWVAGVRFRPGAAIDLLGVSARELRDGGAPASEVWGPSGRTLDARLAEARGAGEALRILEEDLSARAAVARSPDARIARAVRALQSRDAGGAPVPVPRLSAMVGVGERQLERLFDERVGYGPKVFARVERLLRSVRAIDERRARGLPLAWADVAATCGYADQAHLVREFRALAGVTPATFARERATSELGATGT